MGSYCLLTTLLIGGLFQPMTSQFYIGNDLILRDIKYDNAGEQTVVDRYSNFTKDGFLLGWKFYSHWMHWFNDPPKKPLYISLGVWRCSEANVCDVTPRHRTHIVIDETLGDTIVEVLLPRPLPVSEGDCLSYSTRGTYGMIPYDKLSGVKGSCLVDNKGTKNGIELRKYSYRALFRESYPESPEGTIFGHFYNTKHTISEEGHNVLVHRTRSRFTCAGFCTRASCMSFSYSEETNTCQCSEDNAFPYTRVRKVG